MYTKYDMDPIYMGKSFKTEVIDRTILHVVLGNATDNNEVDQLEKFLHKSHDIAVEIYHTTGEMVSGLIDLTHFSSYSPKVISIIASVLKDNKPYIKKTATYGANPFIKLAEETVYALAGRDNFKAFDSKDEAIAWLKNDKPL